MKLFTMTVDKADKLILSILQQDSRLSIADLAERVNLSTSACHRRVKRLEQQGIIDKYGARLDPTKLGYHLEILVEISLNAQSEKSLDEFERAAIDCDEILECHLMAGDADYQIRVAARDANHYEQIHRNKLSRLPHVTRMKSNMIIRTAKPWSGYYLL